MVFAGCEVEYIKTGPWSSLWYIVLILMSRFTFSTTGSEKSNLTVETTNTSSCHGWAVSLRAQ